GPLGPVSVLLGERPAGPFELPRRPVTTPDLEVLAIMAGSEVDLLAREEPRELGPGVLVRQLERHLAGALPLGRPHRASLSRELVSHVVPPSWLSPGNKKAPADCPG